MSDRLFDAEGLPVPEELALTFGDGPLARSARVGFLAGMLALWFYDGNPTAAQKEHLKDEARAFLRRMTRDRG